MVVIRYSVFYCLFIDFSRLSLGFGGISKVIFLGRRG